MGVGIALLGTVISAGASMYSSHQAASAQEDTMKQAAKDRKAAEAKANQLKLNANKSDSDLDEGDVVVGGSDRTRKRRKGVASLTNSASGGAPAKTSGLVI